MTSFQQSFLTENEHLLFVLRCRIIKLIHPPPEEIYWLPSFGHNTIQKKVAEKKQEKEKEEEKAVKPCVARGAIWRHRCVPSRPHTHILFRNLTESFLNFAPCVMFFTCQLDRKVFLSTYLCYGSFLK